MASRRFSRKPPLEVCSEWLADDGIDPRLVRKERGKVSNRKALQLCRQVEHALVFALEGELLRDLIVRSVMPAPDSRRLLVTFAYSGVEQIGDVIAALQGCYTKLRTTVAASIHRRKTPELSFQVVRA